MLRVSLALLNGTATQRGEPLPEWAKRLEQSSSSALSFANLLPQADFQEWHLPARWQHCPTDIGIDTWSCNKVFHISLMRRWNASAGVRIVGGRKKKQPLSQLITQITLAMLVGWTSSSSLPDSSLSLSLCVCVKGIKLSKLAFSFLPLPPKLS